MPRTAAWRKFQTSRRETLQLLTVAEAAEDSLPAGVRLSLRERQLRLYVVALIASLQAYVNDLLEEICDLLPEHWTALSAVQKRYVGTHIHRLCSQLVQKYPETDLSDEKRVEQFTKQISSVVGWYDKPSGLSASVLKQDLEGFLGDNGSKSLDKALTLHRPDGMRFSDWLGSQPLHRATLEVLDNAIRLRNEAAHGQIGQRVTAEDARRYRAVVTRLVQKADEYVSEPANTQEATAPLAQPAEAGT